MANQVQLSQFVVEFAVLFRKPVAVQPIRISFRGVKRRRACQGEPGYTEVPNAPHVDWSRR